MFESEYPSCSDIKRFGSIPGTTPGTGNRFPCILNTTIAETNPLYGYPFPGTFVVSPAGVVTARVFEPSYQERDTISSVLVRLGGASTGPPRRFPRRISRSPLMPATPPRRPARGSRSFSR